MNFESLISAIQLLFVVEGGSIMRKVPDPIAVCSSYCYPLLDNVKNCSDLKSLCKYTPKQLAPGKLVQFSCYVYSTLCLTLELM